jgi:hypothetical protein
MFRAFSSHHQELSDCSGILWFYLRIVVIVVLLFEAATAVIELLMIGGRTPEARRAVYERQDNGLENCCIWM